MSVYDNALRALPTHFVPKGVALCNPVLPAGSASVRCFRLHVATDNVLAGQIDAHELAPAVREMLLDQAGRRGLSRAINGIAPCQIFIESDGRGASVGVGHEASPKMPKHTHFLCL